MISRNISIACVGDHNSGKSTFLQSLCTGGKRAEASEVVLFDKETVEVKIDASFTSVVDVRNTSGKEDLESIRRSAITGVEGVLACFSLIEPKSLESLVKKWIPEVRQCLGPDIPIVLIGTKCDARESLLVDEHDSPSRVSKRITPVQSKEGAAVCRKLKLNAFLEVSALEGEGVTEAVIELLKAATLFKVKHGHVRLQTRPSSGSTTSPGGPIIGSPRASIMSRLLSSSRASTKVRLSQRLLEVASQGETSEALELLSKGAHVSGLPGNSKSSALHAAATSGNVDMLNIFLYAGADVKLQDANGATALHVACSCGHFDCAKALLDRGADVNAKNLLDSTPLHDAAGAGSRDIVRLLLERGADENAKDISGHTPSERAAVAGFPLLIDFDTGGEDEDTIEGKTPAESSGSATVGTLDAAAVYTLDAAE